MALRDCGAPRRHGDGRRRNAPHRFRTFDCGMAPGHRCPAAAQRSGMDNRVRQIPDLFGIRACQQGHDPCRIQADLLVGVGASIAGAPDRRSLSAAASLLSAARMDRAGAQMAPMADLCARRPARRHRLVDGGIRPHRARRCRAGTPRHPPHHGLPYSGCAHLDGAISCPCSRKRRNPDAGAIAPAGADRSNNSRIAGPADRARRPGSGAQSGPCLRYLAPHRRCIDPEPRAPALFAAGVG